MISHGKRRTHFIDLEGDENVGPNRKNQRMTLNGALCAQPHSNQSLGPSSSQGQIPSAQVARDAWRETNEEFDVIDLSQDNDEGSGWVLLGAINDKIVGIRYYTGVATPGEAVLVRREPSNPYDRNAIRINNVQGTQIGHINRLLAGKLAPFLDQRSIVIEATLAGEKGAFDCPIYMKIYGPGERDIRDALEDRLKESRVPLKKQGIAAPKRPKKTVPLPNQRSKTGYLGSSQGGSSNQSVPAPLPELGLQHFMENSERFRPRDVEKLVQEWGVGEAALSKMPMAEQPEKLKSTLLPYQRQGLAWMLEKENPKLPTPDSNEVAQLWKRHPQRRDIFQNIATSFSTSTPPVLAAGGILADDMGLGKTLQVISLILQGEPGTTLIIAPVSVMSNWAQQMERHIKEEHSLKVLTYHGAGRKCMLPKDFQAYDVVITTYGMLSTGLFPGGAKTPLSTPTEDGIFAMNWARVVLDEGHIIRNANTKSAVAATALVAKSKWVLTGTPIVNNMKDLYSMLRYLGVTGGLERMDIFNAILTRPLSLGNEAAEKILQSIMRTLCLRRKKDMKFVDLKLPEVMEFIHRIAFRNDEKEKYEAIEAEAKGIKRTITEGRVVKGVNAYPHLLEVLLRLRQVCCHWKLCGARVTDILALLESDEAVALTKENRAALQVLLQLSIDNHEECSICLEELHNPIITACKHAFGQECIERTIELQHKCPMCRAELKDKDCLVYAAVGQDAEDADIDVNTKSSKTEALMSILKASRKDPLSKVVIFSQWTSFLNIIQAQLEEANMKYTRIDGAMSVPKRDAAMTALDQDPECRIMLASLAVCSVGLNLVAADTVILADSWWSPAIEDQAVDRVNRLGQTRPVSVWRLVMEGSIEERVLDIQTEKRKLVSKAFQETVKGVKEKTTRMGDILKLIG
ncbi:SNF2 family N-terminal domain-containing protein [Amylocarpus encephaloides]|uniref:SNF2 family N-terminal domain-containing protein n=1 Tax=Amylocarpus encephaloides TaxID=45428 RepID=A0A9P7YH53_9HELO|nr:SNF2 family N-terminal domain-containing protein [Amylocarpus encephaloides]